MEVYRNCWYASFVFGESGVEGLVGARWDGSMWDGSMWDGSMWDGSMWASTPTENGGVVKQSLSQLCWSSLYTREPSGKADKCKKSLRRCLVQGLINWSKLHWGRKRIFGSRNRRCLVVVTALREPKIGCPARLPAKFAVGQSRLEAENELLVVATAVVWWLWQLFGNRQRSILRGCLRKSFLFAYFLFSVKRK
jgi:hypothetical protein